MMWIVGADAVGSALSQFRGGPVARIAAAQLDHSPWAGVRCYDLIFPLFVFMVGVAIPYSLDKIVASGGRSAAVRRILLRTALLYLLGNLLLRWLLAAGARPDPPPRRPPADRAQLLRGKPSVPLAQAAGPLGRVCRAPGRLLGAYDLHPGAGFRRRDLAEGHNLANWIDAHYLPFRKYDGDHDPEGLLSAFPAVGTCLLGVFAGRWIKEPGRSSRAKVGLLAVAGCALLAAGFLWGLQFPVIKKVWTSSFSSSPAAGACCCSRRSTR